MKVGVQFPLNAREHDHDALRLFVGEVERLGFDSIWLGDHIVIPESIADMDSYPYRWRFSDDLDHFFPDKAFLEAVAVCGFIAGASTRVEIGVGVFVVPMRNPVELAKQLASIDVVSGGRLIAGVGAGWLREEFDALGMPYERRGARLEESIELMRKLWTGEPVTFAGEFFSVRDITCLPRPARPEGPPVWLGGHSKIAFDRCVRMGSGWHAIELPPDEFEHHSRRLSERLVEAGRDPNEVVRSVACRLPLSGPSLDEARSTVEAYREAGCDHLVVYATPTRSVVDNLERFGRLSREVVPAAAGSG